MISNQLKSFIINSLRRSTFRWPERGKAEKRFRVPHGHYKNGKVRMGYQCAHCKEVFMKKDTCLDHIEPVVPDEGFTTFDSYIERMFCSADNFQILCQRCHDTKSADERERKKQHRHKKKLDKQD